MSGFQGTPRVLRGAFVTLDAERSTVQRILPFQYNPDTLTRSLQARGVSGEGGDRLEAQRLTGPPVETIRLEAEIDATDLLEFPNENPDAVDHGIHPHLAALETLIYPRSEELISNDKLASFGTLEIAPSEAPLTVFVWGKNRVVPILITDFSITEEAFDTQLNATRSRVSLTLRVLSVNDLPFDHKGANLFMSYYQQREVLAQLAPTAELTELGLASIG